MRLTAIAMAATVVAVMVALWGGAPQAQRPGSMEERGGCPYNYAPVCGTDGRTHANRCIASSHRAGFAYEGQCRPRVPIRCQRGAGPACGADGQDYSTRCDALTEGTEVAHDGACVPTERRPPPVRCGGRNDVRCPGGQVCDLSRTTIGQYDAMGFCRRR